MVFKSLLVGFSWLVLVLFQVFWCIFWWGGAHEMILFVWCFGFIGESSKTTTLVTSGYKKDFKTKTNTTQ